jgi:hypothetical protein
LMCQHGMERKGFLRPSFFNVTFILQAKGVSVVVMSACNIYFEVFCYCR